LQGQRQFVVLNIGRAHQALLAMCHISDHHSGAAGGAIGIEGC
jgi:hypothetical protein